MKPKKFYDHYERLLKEGKPLPEGVTVSIGSEGSLLFSDTIKVSESIERNIKDA